MNFIKQKASQKSVKGMNFKITAIGTVKDKQLIPLIEEYIRRIKRFAAVEFNEIKEKKEWKTADPKSLKKMEGEVILQQIKTGDLVVLLDEKGKTLSSMGLADELQKWMNRSPKCIHFIIGGPFGFSEEVYASASIELSLSKMTFTHDMVRLFLTEQIYRAYTIIHHEPYHHE
jgi:23S rRNA (pseudouridine1915-N3)-methyltransferase